MSYLSEICIGFFFVPTGKSVGNTWCEIKSYDNVKLNTYQLPGLDFTSCGTAS